MAPFGAGMGASGGICGILSGALAVIGFSLGKTEAGGRDHHLMLKLSRELVGEFAEISRPYGGPNCYGITGVDWSDRQAVKCFRKDPEGRRKNCFRLVRETTECLYDLIEENFPR